MNEDKEMELMLRFMKKMDKATLELFEEDIGTIGIMSILLSAYTNSLVKALNPLVLLSDIDVARGVLDKIKSDVLDKLVEIENEM